MATAKKKVETEEVAPKSDGLNKDGFKAGQPVSTAELHAFISKQRLAKK